ncbi:unnamed protein product [Urochloa decumbens]|uniref:Uncharacterized protein n=1 Tax=Urochloa decumbens TaxID=240449 RepID=A0ABC9EZF3_9POAL
MFQLFPLPYQGHINPMSSPSTTAARGRCVPPPALPLPPDASLHPHYHFVPVHDGGARPAAASPDTVHATVEHILALNRACEAPFRELLAAVLDDNAGGSVACLVADAHLLTLLDVARELGVPTLALCTGSAACFGCFTAFPMLCDKGYLPAQDTSQLDAPVVELPPYRVGDLPAARSPAAHGRTREVLRRAVTAVAASSGLILNTFDALEHAELAALRRDLTVPVFDVGPLHMLSPPAAASASASTSCLLRPDRGCLEWLDAQAPASVLYVSFGSLAVMSAADLVETAWGIASSGRPFLWVLRPGIVRGGAPSPSPPHLPDGFDAATRGRGAVVRWAPQEEVLAHDAVGAFWTHCGWNSTLEAVCAGVPMLCSPCFGDQMGNARYVDNVWRVGVELDGSELERGKVAAAIAAVMDDGGGEPGATGGMRRRTLEMKRRAAESIGVGGSSVLNVDMLASLIQSL